MKFYWSYLGDLLNAKRLLKSAILSAIKGYMRNYAFVICETINPPSEPDSLDSKWLIESISANLNSQSMIVHKKL